MEWTLAAHNLTFLPPLSVLLAEGAGEELGKGAVYVTIGTLIGNAMGYLISQWKATKAQTRAEHKQDEADLVAGQRELIERYKLDRVARDAECQARERELEAEVDNLRLWVQWLTVKCERAVTRMEFMEDDMKRANLTVRKWVEPPMPSGLQPPPAPEHEPLPTTVVNSAGKMLVRSPTVPSRGVSAPEDETK